MNKFSIIIPCYNAESTLARCIESINHQSFQDYECFIVDDCSTDNSLEVANRLSQTNSKIKVLSMSKNSGNPRMPREQAMSFAKGEFFVFIDADDEVESDYLGKMAECISTYGVDIVLPIMQFWNETDRTELGSKPEDGSVLFDTLMSGRDACYLTIPHYQIGCNGMAFRKELYNNVERENRYLGGYSDEISERIILFYADKVVQSTAVYIYYQNSSSVTHKRNMGYYQYIYADKCLVNFCQTHLHGEKEHEMVNTMISHYLVLYKDFLRHKSELSEHERQSVREMFSDIHSFLQSEYHGDSIKARVYLLNEKTCHLICNFSKLLKRQ